MERKVGEIFEFQGKWYKTVADKLDKCNCCVFSKHRNTTCGLYRDNIIGNCSILGRADKTSVVFKKLDTSPSFGSTKGLNTSKRKLLLFI